MTGAMRTSENPPSRTFVNKGKKLAGRLPWSARRSFLRVLWSRDGTQLSHHAKLVEVVPALHHLTFLREPEDADPRDVQLLARGRYAPELASVGAAHPPAGDQDRKSTRL